MKKILLITILLSAVLIGSVLAMGNATETTNAPTPTTTIQPRLIAMHKELRENFTNDRQALTDSYRAQAEELRKEFITTYGNNTEALREAYKERAKEMIRNYTGDIKELAQDYRARNAEELKGYIDAQREEYQKQAEAQQKRMKEKVKERIQKENEVRIAVHAFLAMENLTGGIGPNVSAIARNFNNGIANQTRVIERAENRSGLARAFAGGNKEDAKELYKEAKLYKGKITELRDLRKQARLDNETATIYDKQIQTLQQEQARLQKLARKENRRGLLGWIWKHKAVSSQEEANLVGNAKKPIVK